MPLKKGRNNIVVGVLVELGCEGEDLCIDIFEL
jgi:hypothetical protein